MRERERECERERENETFFGHFVRVKKVKIFHDSTSAAMTSNFSLAQTRFSSLTTTTTTTTAKTTTTT